MATNPTEFLIQGSTLEATANTIRDLTREYTFDSIAVPVAPVFGGPTVQLAQDAMIIGFVETFDAEVTNEIVGVSQFCLGEFDYRLGFDVNNQGYIVPVLFHTWEAGQPPDKLYYEGTAELDGTIYDKWRVINSNYYDIEGGVTWDSQKREYKYTTRIVDQVIYKEGQISPIDFPEKIEQTFKAGYTAGKLVGQIDSDSQEGAYNTGYYDGYKDGHNAGRQEGINAGYTGGWNALAEKLTMEAPPEASINTYLSPNLGAELILEGSNVADTVTFKLMHNVDSVHYLIRIDYFNVDPDRPNGVDYHTFREILAEQIENQILIDVENPDRCLVTAHIVGVSF